MLASRSSIDSRAVLRIVATVIACGAIAACGYKGPLYLPDDASGQSQQTDLPPPPSPDPTTMNPSLPQ